MICLVVVDRSHVAASKARGETPTHCSLPLFRFPFPFPNRLFVFVFLYFARACFLPADADITASNVLA